MSISTAQAGTIRSEQFFDFEYAKSLWLSGMDYDALVAYDAENCPADGAYEKWKANGRNLKELENHPQADEVKRCNDLWLTSQIWNNAARGAAWNSLEPEPFNQITSKACGWIQRHNIFTRQCNDMPDWRSPDLAKITEERLMRYQAQQVTK